MTALPITNMQQSFKSEIKKFKQQFMFAIQRLEMSLSYSVCRKKEADDTMNLNKMSAEFENCPR